MAESVLRNLFYSLEFEKVKINQSINQARGKWLNRPINQSTLKPYSVWRRLWLRPPLFSAGRTLYRVFFAFRVRWGAVPSFLLRSLSFIYVPVDWRTSILRSCQADQQKIPKIRSIISSYATFFPFPPSSLRRNRYWGPAHHARQQPPSVVIQPLQPPSLSCTFPYLNFPIHVTLPFFSCIFSPVPQNANDSG